MKLNHIITALLILGICSKLIAQETRQIESVVIQAPEILSGMAGEIRRLERQNDNALVRKIVESADLICSKSIIDTSAHDLDFLYDASERIYVPDNDLAVYSSVTNNYLPEISFNELGFRVLNAMQRHMESLFISLPSQQKLINIPIYTTTNLETGQKKTRLFRRQLWILSASEKKEEKLRCWLAVSRMLTEIDIPKSESGDVVIQRSSYGIIIPHGEIVKKLSMLSENEADEDLSQYSAAVIKAIQTAGPKFTGNDIDIYLNELGNYKPAETLIDAKAMALYDSACSSKNRQEKILLFTGAIKLDPGFSAAYNNRGLCYYEQEDYNAAAEDFRKVLDLDAGYTAAYTYLGNCNFKAGKLNEALKNFTEALKYDISDTLYIVRGTCFQKLGRYEQAVNDFSQAIKFNSKSVNAHLSRVQCYLALKLYDHAAGDYQKLIKLDPAKSTYYYNLGCIYAIQKNWSRVIEIWEKGLLVNPEDKTILNNLPKAKANLERQKEKERKSK